uniref:Protein kinase domain-containing protein n=1 Tax=Kalanchoe fedtschenkoi TaxID=63787 RepID=A0A7N0VAX0_KALFE
MGFLLVLLLICSISAPHLVLSDDADALLSLKSTIDPLNSLHWQSSDNSNVCNWQGVKACLNGRVSKLVLENLNLTGALDEQVLDELDQLRVLSFKQNSIYGHIPNLSSLRNLKSLFLDFNNFTGSFPASISQLHRLKVASLSHNNLSGEIPASLLNLHRLYALYLQNNKFTGQIPPLNQPTLRYLNLSGNLLSGEIPITAALIRFNLSSFSGNLNLCGEQIGRKCRFNFPPEISPVPLQKPKPSHSSNNSRWKKIVAGSVGGAVVLLLILALLLCFACSKGTSKNKSAEDKGKGIEEQPPPQQQQEEGGTDKTGSSNGGGGGGGGFSWEREGIGRLVFCGSGEEQMSYSLEDLLKASAETLGRGTMGSTYKAVMESGFIVTVKRLKDARFPRTDEFKAHVEAIGRLRHLNLVPLRAYFQAKEERLLVYDYFPNGSLFSLIHGSRSTGGGKPLHWTSCLKIAEDLATGLLYIHQSGGLTHGNLKSSNVLLGSDFESCLTDYGLTAFRDPDSHEETSATALFYRAPECRDIRKYPTQQADVYSFGVLLLELLTGKTPFQDLVQEHGSDIPRWVKSVREEETESGDEPNSGNEASSEEKLAALLNIAMSCVSLDPETRPVIGEILKMIRDTRAEAQVSSNSSDHSPGRWSDTVQSLPREEHLSI